MFFEFRWLTCSLRPDHMSAFQYALRQLVDYEQSLSLIFRVPFVWFHRVNDRLLSYVQVPLQMSHQAQDDLDRWTVC